MSGLNNFNMDTPIRLAQNRRTLQIFVIGVTDGHSVIRQLSFWKSLKVKVENVEGSFTLKTLLVERFQ